jgi:hypothetical protein
MKPAIYKGKLDLEQIIYWLLDKAGIPGRNSEIRSLKDLKDKVEKHPNLAIFVGNRLYSRDKEVSEDFLTYIEV